jgi:hypothetical protein
MHLYLTLNLLAHIYYVIVVGWNYPLSLITIRCEPQRGYYRSHNITKLHQKSSRSNTMPHPIPFPLIKTKEDLIPLVTLSMAIMTVVHFAKISTLYPRVVISSLAKWLEKPSFCHSYTSSGVWHRDQYMPLQRITMCHMPGLAKVVHSTIAMVRFSGVVAVPWWLLHHVSLDE